MSATRLIFLLTAFVAASQLCAQETYRWIDPKTGQTIFSDQPPPPSAKQVTKTATQAEDEAAQEMSPLQTMAERFEDFIDQVLQYFALWKGETEGGHVKVNGNFDVDFAPETTLPLLLNMATQGRLSDETLFNEYKRRGVVSDDIEWELEKQKIADQGPSLGML